jgi:hypothetical protein
MFKFKNILVYSLILSVMMLLTPANTMAEPAADLTISADPVILTHSVDRQSLFTYESDTSTIAGSGTTKIGTVTLENNTRDGFSFTVTSAQSGVLSPGSTPEDGEVAIPYTLKFSKSGTLGTGLNLTSEHTTAAGYDSGTTSTVISFPDGSTIASSATAVTMIVAVIIASSQSQAMALAGDYTDTLTFTYTDI